MQKLKKFLSIIVVIVFSFTAILVTSCAWHPDEEEIQKLEETKAAALSAEKKLSDKKAERQALENEVNSKTAELEKTKKEKEKVANAVESANAAGNE